MVFGIGNLIKGTTFSLLADADEVAGDRWPCCTSGGRDFTHFSFTFMHLADAFIQSDVQCHSGYSFLIYFSVSKCVPWEVNPLSSLGSEPTIFCAANAMLYHWATGTHGNFWELTSQICALCVTNRIKSCYWSKHATIHFFYPHFHRGLVV